jgi:hypothetical protein
MKLRSVRTALEFIPFFRRSIDTESFLDTRYCALGAGYAISSCYTCRALGLRARHTELIEQSAFKIVSCPQIS